MSRPTAELIELTALFCEESLSPEQAARLESLVAESADARQYTLDSFHMHCELAWEYRLAVPASSKSSGASGVAASLPDKPASRQLHRWLVGALALAMTAAIAIGLTIADRKHHVINQASPPSIARIERINGVRWADAAAAPGDSLAAGSKLAVRRGLVQIRFESGARVVLRGPAQIEMQSPTSVLLGDGELTAEAPLEARGFAVQTPNATIVDQGTRFGVACQTGETEVEVFTGNVLVKPRATLSDPTQEQTLAAGGALRVSGTSGTGRLRIETISAGSRKYAQSIDETPQPRVPACACPTAPQAAGELIGSWHNRRGPRIPLDLSGQANWDSTQSTPDRAGNSLVELTPGSRLLAGVEFQVGRRLIQLHGAGLPKLPWSAEGIPVGHRVARLYLLQGTQFSRPGQKVEDGDLIAEYRVRYADGNRATIPVVLGQDVRDWWGSKPEPVTRGQVAWAGSNPAVERSGLYLRLYLSVWENPHPEKTVENIAFVAIHKSSGPFCVAITAEEPLAVVGGE
jgi:hypothetical protein